MLVLLISLYCWPRSHAATVTLPDPIYLETFHPLNEEEAKPRLPW